jgi:2'-5' RNA ligase
VPRLRLGVALVLPEPVATEIDGLRRALGDPAFGRVTAHLTLVPPLNVRLDDLPAALAVLRAAAASTGPAVLPLGPPATFHPVSPVVYLGVGEPGAAAWVGRLRDAVFRVPLSRPLTHPFVPHVTLGGEGDPARIEAALLALRDYRVEVRVEEISLLQEGPSPARAWTPVADASFGPLAVVGRGGWPVELATSTIVDPEASALLGLTGPSLPPGVRGRVVTARRDGAVVGVAAGWQRGHEAAIEQLVVATGELADVERHLRAAFAVGAVGPYGSAGDR